MNKTLTGAAIALTLGLTAASNAAITIVTDGGATNRLSITNGTSTWDTQVAGANANIYWDANTNGAFGDIGENSGNTAGSLAFTINIVSGTTYEFAFESFGGAATTGSTTFLLTNTDLTTQTLTVTEGATLAFSDSNGDSWEADFSFNREAYGDVVGNVSHVAGGGVDHQGTLTFTNVTAVPEPSSTALLGLGGLALILRRRK